MHGSVAYLLLAMMVVTTVPVAAVSPPGSLEVPDPEDWGVPAELRLVQATEEGVINELTVVNAANGMLSVVEAYDIPRNPATGPYYLHGSSPPAPSVPDVVDLVSDTPNGTLPSVLQVLLDQPLKVAIYVESGDHVNWIEAFLRVSLLGRDEDGNLRFINWQKWEYVDIDNDTTTGDPTGADMRVRFRLVTENLSAVPEMAFPPKLSILVRGGFAIEVERLGSGNEDLPLDMTFFKSFRYSGINYTWFLDYEVDHLPDDAFMSITAENVNATVGGNLASRIIDMITGGGDENGTDLNGSRLTNITGPYTITHRTSEDLDFLHASLGYLKIAQDPLVGDPRLEEASWLTAHVLTIPDEGVVPHAFSLWLDSPSFNRTFDHLRWTATGRSRLELEYFDARENNTQAKAIVDIAPTRLEVRIGEAQEDVGRVAKIHFTASDEVGLISFDAWDFTGVDRRKYLYTHVALEGMPKDVWLNGTIDVGGQEYDVLRPDPRVGNFLPQMLDIIMVGLTSKLFNIGQTLRALPQSLLDMPDQEGYFNVEFPNASAHLGKLEMFLTSGQYVTLEEGTDFLAFYNNSHHTLESPMVETGFSLRLLDIRAFHAEFRDKKQIVLDSRYNREFRALFIDEANQANASIRLSNIPHNISLELLDEQVVYMGDGTVDRIQYTSEIRDQYIRMQLDGVPGGMHFLLGNESTGIDVLVGEIDTITILLTDGPLRSMEGDHLLLERDPAGTTSVSMRISGIRSVLLRKGEENTVALRTGGEPFNILVADEAEDFHMKAQLDPLPLNIEAGITDLLGISDIKTPSLKDVTSVLEFASLMYSISDLADDLLVAMGDATTGMIEGLGGFSSNLTFSFDGDRNMDLAATVTHAGSLPVPEAPWVHGIWTNMLPDTDGDVLIDTKMYLSGIAPRGSIDLRSSAESTHLDLRLYGFAPQLDHLLVLVNGSSLIEGGSGKDVWLYMSDLATPIDMELMLDLDADVALGGTVAGDLVLRTSHAIGPLHMRTRIRNENVATVEVLLSNVPREADLSFSYSSDLSLDVELSEGLRFAFVKMTRNLGTMDAPATSVTLHDVPSLVSVSVRGGGEYDMDAPDPLAALPDVSVSTNEPGMDALVDIDGRSLGNKADFFLDVRNVEELSLTSQEGELRFSAGRLDFLHIGVSGMVYSDTTWIDRLDIAATHLTRATLKVHMVFGVYPLIDVDDLVASGLQLAIAGRAMVRGTVRDLSLTLFEVPMSMRSMPRSHADGAAVRQAGGEHRLFVPAPIGTMMGTLMG